MKMAVVSMEEPSGHRPGGVRNRDSAPHLGFAMAASGRNQAPSLIFGLAGGQRVKFARSTFTGATGNRHAIVGTRIGTEEGLKGPEPRRGKGQWWPCDVIESELKTFENEGLLAPESWKFTKDSITPTPDPDERVFTKAWVERGLSLPPSEFFLLVLSTYGLQPHNIYPNSYTILSNFATLCKGYLGVCPDVRLLQVFYRVKKETKDKTMVNYGSITFVLRKEGCFRHLLLTSPFGTGMPDGST
ncbi:hypothetical protein QYE76_044547 [Lolium multiflorum]|uniref:Transposase (putative) gypsy type domain-containing protein n=1 Tax=Lolium multiflorum TaxID=4521 RepID=A0AAD8TL66_LOLMU|nr:hypothetical protein QYE76_044547 [Lolium multiflorum]